MSLTTFPKDYRKRNYKIITVDLSRSTTIETTGDWIDIFEYPPLLDLSRVFIAFDGGDAIPLSHLPITTPFQRITIVNTTTTTGTLKLIVGEEFKREKELIGIAEDRVGLAKDSTLARAPIITRLGRYIPITWVIGSEIIAPAANTNLVARTVSSGRIGWIYGFTITTPEPNAFQIVWVSDGTTRTLRYEIPTTSSLIVVSLIALNEGLGADSDTTVSIRNLNAGSGVYQAALLYGEW